MTTAAEDTAHADPADPADPDDHAYFQAIEETFVALRGAPLLLSPADWQVSRRWHRDGIPLDLIRSALRDVFERRKERGVKGKISSLRYCAPAIEAAWEERRELSTPGERTEAPPFELADRLHALAGRLPSILPGRDLLAGRVEALNGDPQSVEEALSGLDQEMLATAAESLGGEDRAAVDAAVEKTLASLRSRLPAEELERSRERLTHQILRQRLGLPVLSLFSPDAEP